MSLSCDNLAGKVCVVTGSVKSIGFGIAKKLAEQGAKVVMLDLNPEIENSAKNLKAAGMDAVGFVLDVSDRDAVLSVFETIRNEIGDIYALVNSAGIADQRPFEETPAEIMDRMFRVNVNGTAWCIQGALPSMKKNQCGKIINFSSKSGKTGSAMMAPYSAAKGAVIALTQALAFEFARYKLNINCICPGIVDNTGVWDNVSADYVNNLGMSKDAVVEKMTEKIPLKRLTSIGDVVDLVFYLVASGDYCTGQAYNISGGREMH